MPDDVPAEVAEDVRGWPTGRLLSTAARLVEHSWEAQLARHGLTHAGMIALHSLRSGPLSQRELARACRVTDQTISRTVERLERAQLLTRTLDPADERRQLVRLTDAGRAVHEQVVAAQHADAVLAGAVSDHEALRALLVELVTALGGRAARP
ncbi:MarR family transcriptional regulator [Rhodococcus sp. X156]|uniref:MarR family winged helix-turn-helix transcriptional regulator n=1 Tax=Rhodococcus sp. X156 TaxID=2499145 RepID=UPI000FD767CB|nr:MarR family transcriptional regulator [Rhodococcus sp. X156]